MGEFSMPGKNSNAVKKVEVPNLTSLSDCREALFFLRALRSANCTVVNKTLVGHFTHPVIRDNAGCTLATELEDKVARECLRMKGFNL